MPPRIVLRFLVICKLVSFAFHIMEDSVLVTKHGTLVFGFVDYHACVLPQNMPGSLESLFKNETYKAILMASGGIQVMAV